MSAQVIERNQEATCYVGNLDERVTDDILYELFLQAGPIVNLHVPKDRVTGHHQSFGFVEYLGEEDADYAIKILNMIKLYGKPIRVNKASTDKKNLDVGANLFIGNLDPEVDEKLLYDTFSAFGVILQTPKIMRDQDTGNSKGFAFVNYASFEASDAAIEAMNGQHLANRPISVTYAYRKDAKGERHGSAAERMLAQQNATLASQRPHQLFGDNSSPLTQAPPVPPSPAPPGPPPPGMFPPGMGPPPGFSAPPPGMHPPRSDGTAQGAPPSHPPMAPPGPPPPGPPPGMPPGPPPGFMPPPGFAPSRGGQDEHHGPPPPWQQRPPMGPPSGPPPPSWGPPPPNFRPGPPNGFPSGPPPFDFPPMPPGTRPPPPSQ